ncbi:MAG: TetR/AcrR family transcriptional regulator [Bryobacteraceae bacterium]|nr:TetR/AcrR family transcriptional regulator [Bryobacteraceae bacterium]
MLAPANPGKGDHGAGRQRMSGQDRRQAIIEAAVKLFSEKGFRGVTTRELAAAVGVSEPVLYQHFATKRDLYTAIIDAKSQEGQEKFSTFLGPFLQMDDDRGFLLQLADLILHFYSADPAYIRLLLFSALEDHELKEIAYQRQKLAFIQLVASYFERRMAAGALRRIDPAIAAQSFMGMVANYAMGAVIFGCIDLEATRDQVIPAMVDVFLTGLRA